MNRKFWKKKKIFLTGHTGFKGTWMSFLLKEMGAIVCGYSLKEKNNLSIFNQTHCKTILDQNIYGDIRDYNFLQKKLKNFNPDVIIHMAAQALVIDSIKNPLKTFSTNCLGTANVLNISRDLHNVKSIIIITTDKVYKRKNIYLNESSELGGKEPYSASKVCAEIISKSFSTVYLEKAKKNVATIRAGNIIGGGDCSKNRLLPDYFRSLTSKKKISIRNPDHIRPWQYVLDALNAYLLIIEHISKFKNNNFTSWNVAPEKENHITVRNLIRKLKKITKKENINLNFKKDLTNVETSVLKLSNIKIKKAFGWKSKYNLDKALNMIIEWHDFRNEKKYKDLIKKQIKDFLNE